MNIDFDNVILKKFEIGYASNTSSKTLNVAYGVDRNFLFGSGISMTSVLEHNSDIDFHFYIVTDYVNDDYIDCVTHLVQTYATSVTILLFNNEEFRKLPSTKAWTCAMYYRYVAFEYLSNELESVLYLDADIICKGQLRELLDITFTGEYAAVVNDIDEVRLKSGDRLGISALSQGYFNSGVVYANLVVWKEKQLLQKAFTILLDKQAQLLYFDQDVLNILFVNNVIFLRRDFNCIYGVDQELANKDNNSYQDFINEDTILIHYVGVTKPWHNWSDYPVSRYFLDAYEKSAWSKKTLLKANTAKLYKRKSRHEWVQRKYIKSILSHIMYIKNKLYKKPVH